MCAHRSGDDVPRGTILTIEWWLFCLRIFGHLAGWAVAYSVGVSLVLVVLIGVELQWMGVVYVVLCAHGGYMLDRVKFRDCDLDPADLMADPERHQFLREHAKILRVIMFAEWVGAVVVGTLMSPALGVLVVGGILAGYLYSGWRPAMVGSDGTSYGAWDGRRRMKDIAGLKAFLVSGAIVGLGIAGAYGDQIVSVRIDAGLVWIVVGMGMVVLGDAVICDLDDRVSDGAYCTRSLPVIVGFGFGALIGIVMMVFGGVVLMIGEDDDAGRIGRLLFGLGVVLSGVVITVLGPRIGGRRDWIDARMLGVAMVTLLCC